MVKCFLPALGNDKPSIMWLSHLVIGAGVPIARQGRMALWPKVLSMKLEVGSCNSGLWGGGGRLGSDKSEIRWFKIQCNNYNTW